MRGPLLALFCLCAPSAAAAEPNVSGVWSAQETNSDLSTPNYFFADLTEQDGRVSGAGFVNLCAGCRGWDQYDVTWEGGVKGDRILLRGVPVGPYAEEVRFSGRLSDGRMDGTLVSEHGPRQTFLLIRQAANAE